MRTRGGVELRKRREAVGDNGRAAAARLGVRPETLSRIENGRSRQIEAGVELALAIRTVYGVPLEAWIAPDEVAPCS